VNEAQPPGLFTTLHVMHPSHFFLLMCYQGNTCYLTTNKYTLFNTTLSYGFPWDSKNSNIQKLKVWHHKQNNSGLEYFCITGSGPRDTWNLRMKSNTRNQGIGVRYLDVKWNSPGKSILVLKHHSCSALGITLTLKLPWPVGHILN